MCKVYRVGDDVRVHVDVDGKQCECPVKLVREHGIGLIIAPIDHATRRELLNFPGLAQMIRSFDHRMTSIKLSES
jgi:hypothetical protein